MAFPVLTLSGWRPLAGAHRIDQIRFQSRMLLQVEPLGLPAIQLILVDPSEIGFLSHCLSLPLFPGQKPTGPRLSSRPPPKPSAGL
jgi:hypothetical protein